MFSTKCYHIAGCEECGATLEFDIKFPETHVVNSWNARASSNPSKFMHDLAFAFEQIGENECETLDNAGFRCLDQPHRRTKHWCIHCLAKSVAKELKKRGIA